MLTSIKKWWYKLKLDRIKPEFNINDREDWIGYNIYLNGLPYGSLMLDSPIGERISRIRKKEMGEFSQLIIKRGTLKIEGKHYFVDLKGTFPKVNEHDGYLVARNLSKRKDYIKYPLFLVNVKQESK